MTTDEKTKYLFSKLPQDIYETMLDEFKNEKVKNIGILLGLSEEKIIILFQEVSNFLMGITNSEELKNNLKINLNLNENLSTFTVNKLNEIIFNDLSESILTMRQLAKETQGLELNKVPTTVPAIDPKPLADKDVSSKITENNTERILQIIKNLSQKPIENTANIIDTPTVIKEANPMLKPAPVVQKITTIIKPDPPKTFDKKPNKLLDAMMGLQNPKSKIDTLIEKYNTNKLVSPEPIAEKKIEESEFTSPFMIKKTPSFIQKGDGEISTEFSIPKKEDIPDILKMKEVRESVDQNAKNIKLEGNVEENVKQKEPVRYRAVEENSFKPYQFEKGKDQNTTDKFVDLSEV